jgi:hypothetical protein
MACHSFCIPATADELLHEQSDWRDDLELHRDNARDDIDGMPLSPEFGICRVQVSSL